MITKFDVKELVDFAVYYHNKELKKNARKRTFIDKIVFYYPKTEMDSYEESLFRLAISTGILLYQQYQSGENYNLDLEELKAECDKCRKEKK